MSSTTTSPSRNHPALKIILALLPTLAFTQAYAWMTLNRGIGYAFLLIWVLIILSVWQLTQKNRIIIRLVRLLEIAFFFLPIATIIMTFTAGATLVGGETNEFAKAGATAGLAIGGFLVTIVAFIIGIVGGIITHLVGKGYAAKAKKEPAEKETKLNQHGMVFVLIGFILISIIIPSIIPSPFTKIDSTSNEKSGTPSAPSGNTTTSTSPSANVEPSTPAPLELGQVSIGSDAIDMPEATLSVTNTSDKKVIALKVRMLIYTKFDEPVKDTFSWDDSNEFIGLSQDELSPKGTEKLSWQLTGFTNAGKATAEVYQVKFDDGSEWRSPNFKDTTSTD